jgi:AcrR family transcriptional regulator
LDVLRGNVTDSWIPDEVIQLAKVEGMKGVSTIKHARTAPVRERAAKSLSKPRTKAAQRAETLEKILDAAEYLFSKHGLNGVTLRDVAQKVGVQTPLMHYYFDGKDALFEAVFARRADVSIGRRMKALGDYEKAANGKPTIAGALHAFLDPVFDLHITGGEGWRNYTAFGAQVVNTVQGAERFDHHFDPVVLRLIAILKQALPGVPEKNLFWGYQFVTGSLMHSFARSGRIDRLSGGRCHSDDIPAIKARMADFMAWGFVSFCRPAAEAQKLIPAKSSRSRARSAGANPPSARRTSPAAG